MKNDKKEDDLPQWDQEQIEGQRKINRRLTIRTIIALIIALLVIIIAFVVGLASCNKATSPQKPDSSASISQIEKYEENKFADNNASSIDKISLAKNSKIVLVKVNNVDVSTENSASNSFRQLTDELQSLGTYDVSQRGVMFYGAKDDSNTSIRSLNDLNFAVYFNHPDLIALNSDFSNFVDSGNYNSLFKDADAYYFDKDFQSGNNKLSRLDQMKSERIIQESF